VRIENPRFLAEVKGSGQLVLGWGREEWGKATLKLHDEVSYISEVNFEDSWQESFWGFNYPRLKTIKQKYDPTGLFFVHHGVGTENWSPDGFTLTANGTQ
jgi:hypothetical protein